MIAMLNLHQDMTSKIILEKLFQFFLCLKFNIRWFISIVKIFFYSISLKQIQHTTNFHDSLTTLHPQARQGLEGRAKARSGGSAQRDQRNGAERRNPGKPITKMARCSLGTLLFSRKKRRKKKKKKKSGIIAAVDALLFVVEVDVAGSNQLLGICFAAANHVGIACAQSKFIGF